MGINVWEVIEAAKTKPFGYMPFYPGPGLGGHCIPIDPHYLSWKAKEHNFEARFIELAGHVNRSMPEHVVTLVMDALNTRQKAVNGSRVHVFGVAYKRDVNDLRESPALDIIELLLRRGAQVSYTDPFFASFEHLGHRLTHEDEQAAHVGKDCALIITDHSGFDYRGIVERFPLVVDTRNALKGLERPSVFRL
jgi:UDP-N-acetyl-D-glucosamine dehydrogenase